MTNSLFHTVPLRRMIGSLDNGAWGGEPTGDGDDVLCIRAADFDFDRLRVVEDRAPMRSLPAATRRRLGLLRGDIVLEKSGGGEHLPVGRAVMFDLPEQAVCSNFAARMRPVVSVEPRFLIYALASHFWAGATARCIKQTTGIQNLDTDEWLQTPTSCPEGDVQRQIADFLDEQVGLLDQAIRLREQQVSLLVERLAWVREEAFSPLSARTVALRYVVDFFRDGDWIESPFIADTGIRLLQTGNVGVGRYKDQGFKYITEETFRDLNCTEVLPGDLLISRLSPPVGRACLAPDLGERMVVSVDVAIVRSTVMDHRFLVHYMSTRRHLDALAVASRGATMARVSRSQLGSFPVPLADPSTQRLIADQLDSLEDESQRAVGLLGTSINLLKERKQALIAAAVTGQFDVTTARSVA
jgi:type I restriction enzyme S subunit